MIDQKESSDFKWRRIIDQYESSILECRVLALNEVSGRLKSHFPGARYRGDECALIVSPRDTSVYIQPCDEDDGDDSCAANS